MLLLAGTSSAASRRSFVSLARQVHSRTVIESTSSSLSSPRRALPHDFHPSKNRIQLLSSSSKLKQARIIEQGTIIHSESSILDSHWQQNSSEVTSTEGPSASVYQDTSQIGVTWSSGTESKYHNIWLRDHCRCPQCYHPTTKQRQVDTFAIPANIAPKSVEATIEGLIVEWPRLQSKGITESLEDNTEFREEQSGHSSLYPWSWLYSNSYAPSLSLASTVEGIENIVLWGKGIAQQPPTVTWDEVMSDQNERGVARWLTKLSHFGFCFVNGVPPTPEDTERLVRRISFIRETHYGGFWDFTSDLSHGDTAYTNLSLGAHTDTTYFTDPAGLQLFHLLSHSPAAKDGSSAFGGESLLVDGFFAAKILREVHPKAYETLSTVSISTHSAGDVSTLVKPLKKGGYPILEHDKATGELVQVRYNNDDRSVLRIAEDQVLPFYDALSKWHSILTHTDSEYWSQLVPGTALIFDNHRVLHGRSAFTGNRRLCGAYVSHDDYRSRLAVLREQFPEFEGVRRRITNDTAESHARRGVWDDGL